MMMLTLMIVVNTRCSIHNNMVPVNGCVSVVVDKHLAYMHSYQPLGDLLMYKYSHWDGRRSSQAGQSNNHTVKFLLHR